MTKIKERIIYFIENQGFKKGEFFKEIEVSSANFRGNALKTPLNSSTIENIITIYPQLNLHWLITGKGEMLLESKDSSNKPSTNIATNVETATKREIHLSEEVIALLKEKISDLEKKIETLSNTSSTIEILTRIENKLDTSLETNKTLFSEIEEYFELMKLKENLEKAKNIETHHESKK